MNGNSGTDDKLPSFPAMMGWTHFRPSRSSRWTMAANLRILDPERAREMARGKAARSPFPQGDFNMSKEEHSILLGQAPVDRAFGEGK